MSIIATPSSFPQRVYREMYHHRVVALSPFCATTAVHMTLVNKTHTARHEWLNRLNLHAPGTYRKGRVPRRVSASREHRFMESARTASTPHHLATLAKSNRHRKQNSGLWACGSMSDNRDPPCILAAPARREGLRHHRYSVPRDTSSQDSSRKTRVAD